MIFSNVSSFISAPQLSMCCAGACAKQFHLDSLFCARQDTSADCRGFSAVVQASCEEWQCLPCAGGTLWTLHSNVLEAGLEAGRVSRDALGRTFQT